MHHFRDKLTQIIFFDLEFYVPECDQKLEENGFKANPFKQDHLLLGGTFIKRFPLNKKNDQIEKLWIWEFQNEQELLSTIYKYFQESWNLIKKDENQCDLIISGIGVGRADIGYLYSKCIANNIDSHENLFEIFYHLRILDLEQVSIPSFKSKLKLMYPKSTGELIGKFNLDTIRESGTSVWSLYEEKNIQQIEDRNLNEVLDFLKIYDIILAQIRTSNIAPKYSIESIERVSNRLKSKSDREQFMSCFQYNSEEKRYIVEEEKKSNVLHFFDKTHYWRK